MDRTYQEAEGAYGVFEVWREHERRCVLGLMGSSLPGTSLAAGTPVGTYVEAHSYDRPLRNLVGMGYGVWWMFSQHTVYFFLFGAGVLLIWSWCGGAICRLAAVQFSRDEKPTIRQALGYGRRKLFRGFLLAPCIPLLFIIVIMVFMALGGALLRVWVLGDLIGGPFFFLALLGGFLIAVLLLGVVVGGSLFWPFVAAEGVEAFDAFARGLHFPLARPMKAIVYAVVSIIYASICWVFVNLFTYFALTITRGVVGFGTSPFGWWSRGEEGTHVRKLDLLWPFGGPNALYGFPNWTELRFSEYFSAFFICIYVLLVIGLMWSFLASFYFSASTVIFFLLRRDVEGTDLGDVYIEEEVGLETSPAPATAGSTTPADKKDDVSPGSDTSGEEPGD